MPIKTFISLDFQWENVVSYNFNNSHGDCKTKLEHLIQSW